MQTAVTVQEFDMLLMWFDNSKKAQADKIKDACVRYEAKFEESATLVYVNMDQYDESLVIAGLDIVGARNVLKHHFQVGRLDKKYKV